MDIHNNARLTPRGRAWLVRRIQSGQTPAAAANAVGVCPRTARKWFARYRELGPAGLADRSSRPHRLHRPTPQPIVERIIALRRQRMTGKQIAATVAVSPATVSRILKRHGLSRLANIEPHKPIRRYERAAPGELVHLDIKKLGRFWKTGFRITGRVTGHKCSDGAGYEFAHVAIDDHSRIARIDIMPDEKKESAVICLERTVAYFKALGVTIDRVMTDNGSCYRSSAFAKACASLAIRHIMTKPYTPQTNGKAERFIQTALREWAYATAFQTSQQRRCALPSWLHRYNWHRPHASLASKPPISRLGLSEDNLLRLHT
jgi:transposase InsO family protein